MVPQAHHPVVNEAPPLTAIVSLAFFAISIVPVGALLAYRGTATRPVAARNALLANWRAALAITALYEASSVVRGRPFDATTLVVASWAFVGLALARSIPDSSRCA